MKLVEKMGCNVFVVDYRGYGDSEGVPTEDGLKLDAEAALEFIKKRDDIDQTKVYVYGQGLGGAVAIQLCMDPSIGVRGVMLENTFLSIGAMVDHWMPAVSPFKQFVLQVHFPSDKRIGEVTIPIMFISGAED